MQIQLNTDNHLVGSDDLAQQVEADVRSALSRFAEHITRVEVHFNDVNSDKGGNDQRCMMEARVAGKQPIAVTHQAPSIALAISGALAQLGRKLERIFGKVKAARRSGTKPGQSDAL
jgi:ribosome-associated translation inhibitor RaiA